MKKVILFLSMFFLFSSFVHADFEPQNGINIYYNEKIDKTDKTGKKSKEDNCNYVVEIGNTETNRQLIESIGCKKDFSIIYYDKNNIGGYERDKASQLEIRVITQDNMEHKDINKNSVPVLMVFDEYTIYGKRRESQNKIFESGKPVFFKYNGIDHELRNLYFRITYYKMHSKKGS